MLIIDCETRRPVLPDEGEIDPEVQYARSWRDYEGMGISCVCAFEVERQRAHVFLGDNLQRLPALIEQHEIIVTHGGLTFDAALLGHFGYELPEAKHYDLMREVMAAKGYCNLAAVPSGVGLHKLAVANGLPGKLEGDSGACAPVLWQRREYGRVIEYCLNDVDQTWRLVEIVQRARQLNDPPRPMFPLDVRQPGAMSTADYYRTLSESVAA